jgi:hypothetical protein
MTNREKVMEEILAERENQDHVWGEDHDKGHSGAEWMGIISVYVGKAILGSRTVKEFRHRLIQIAAIAAAAAEHMKE